MLRSGFVVVSGLCQISGLGCYLNRVEVSFKIMTGSRKGAEMDDRSEDRLARESAATQLANELER
jgi:hypothetical protein